MVDTGALADDETVSISPVAPSTLPMAAPSDLIAVAAFQLDLGPDPLSVPVQLSVAVAPGTPSGTNVIFYRADTLPDSSGNPVPVWMQVATGVVGTDGFAHDDTNQTGVYVCGTTKLPNGVVNGAVQAASGINDQGTSYAIEANLGNGAAIGAAFSLTTGFILDIPVQRAIEAKLEAIPKVGLPTITNITLLAQTTGYNDQTFTIDNNTPPVPLPSITSTNLVIQPGQTILRLIGNNFGDRSGTYTVTFQVGARDDPGPPRVVHGGPDYTATQAQGVTWVNPTEVDVIVPNSQGIALGTAQVALTRTFTANNGKSYSLTSNTVQLAGPSAGSPGYTFTALPNGGSNLTGAVAALGQDGSSSQGATIPVSGGPQFLAVTPDNTRVYATLGFVQGIAVIDAETLQQVKVGTSGVITLPGGPTHTRLPSTRGNRRRGVGLRGGHSLRDRHRPQLGHLQSVRANHPRPHLSVVRRGSAGGLRGLAFSSDGSRLAVAAPATRNT